MDPYRTFDIDKKRSSFLWKRLLALCLAVITAGYAWGCGSGGDGGDPSAVLAETCQWLTENVTEPAPAAIGGEWTIVALSRGGEEPSGAEEGYFQQYLAAADQYVKDAGGVLHTKTGYKYTEYARIILGVTAAGGDVTDIGGYNFLEKLTDMENVRRQGVNGPIWALIAYDCGGYQIPKDGTAGENQTSREALIQAILDQQLEDGGWNLDGDAADPDMTAMALTALAPYAVGSSARTEEVSAQTLDAVKAAAEQGVSRLSELQQEDGGYVSMDSDSSESCSQVITALSSLGIDCAADERFIKEGSSVLDALLAYGADGGGFRHSRQDEEVNLMSTEQACYALAAYVRNQKGESTLFDMTE